LFKFFHGESGAMTLGGQRYLAFFERKPVGQQILFAPLQGMVEICNGLINQDTSKDRFIMSLEVKYEQSNQTKKT